MKTKLVTRKQGKIQTWGNWLEIDDDIGNIMLNTCTTKNNSNNIQVRHQKTIKEDHLKNGRKVGS